MAAISAGVFTFDRPSMVARTSIVRLLEQDLTTDEVYEAFRAAERDEVLSMGIAPASPHYLETVVRTNALPSPKSQR